MSLTWEGPPKRWNGYNILQLFRAQASIFCVKSAVIIIYSKCSFHCSRNSISASQPTYTNHTMIVLPGFVMLLCTLIAPQLHHKCTIIAPSNDAAFTLSSRSGLETFTISVLISLGYKWSRMKCRAGGKFFTNVDCFRKILNWHNIFYLLDEKNSLAVFWFVHLNIFLL